MSDSALTCNKLQTTRHTAAVPPTLIQVWWCRSAVTLSVLSRNLPFVVSLLWLLYHTVMFSIPLLWTFAFATARRGASPPAGAPGGLTVDTPTRKPVSTPGPVGSPRTAVSNDSVAKASLGCLGVYSYIAWALCWAAVLLVGVACLGLGDDSTGGKDTDYSVLLSKSLQFYQAQQSGKLVNNPILWRGDSGLSDLPVGGWYEGGSECLPTSLLSPQFWFCLVTWCLSGPHRLQMLVPILL